jgi:pimeloyl-ACP methyl ester carboxylesterase
VGSSYGGLIALDFALNHPGRVRSLVLLEPIAFGLPSVVKEKPSDYSRIEKITIQLKPTAEITDEQIEQFRCLQVNCDSVNIRMLPQWNSWLQQRNKLRGLSATFEHKIDTAQLAQFKKPVLILTGTQTAPLNKRIDELLQKELAGSRLLYIESGHSIPTQAPKELVKDILEFVNN